MLERMEENCAEAGVMSSVVILNIRIKKGTEKYRAKQNSGDPQIESKM